MVVPPGRSDCQVSHQASMQPPGWRPWKKTMSTVGSSPLGGSYSWKWVPSSSSGASAAAPPCRWPCVFHFRTQSGR